MTCRKHGPCRAAFEQYFPSQPSRCGSTLASVMPDAAEFTVFDTAVGRCAIAWSSGGVKLLQLPEGREAVTRARLLSRCPDAEEATPPPAVKRALDAIVALLRGEPVDLSAIELDMEGVPPFHERVYDEARRSPQVRRSHMASSPSG